jgi:hypothetical protein
MSLIEASAPSYVGEQLIILQVAPNTNLLLGQPVLIEANYDAAVARGGVSLPLAYTVTNGVGELEFSRVFTRFKPKTLAFLPNAPGMYNVRLWEIFHNLWFGVLTVQLG